MASPDVIVIGAGMAGVAAARELKEARVSVTVLEARSRAGGRIHTLRDFCDAPVEAGAELIHGKDAQTWPDVREAGLTVRPNSHAAIRIDIGHGARSLPHALAHPQTWKTFTLLRRLGRRESPDTSARQFVERRGYRGRARALAEMVFTAHLPGTLDEIGVHGLVDDGVLHLEMSPDFRVNEGYDRIVEHVARGLDIEFGAVVRSIQWSHTGVTIREAGGRERSARAAIITLPPGVLQTDAVEFQPSLPETKQCALREMVMGPVLKVIMRFAEPFWPPTLAAVCTSSGPVTLYWNVFYRAASPAPVLTAYCTGPRAAALGQIDAAEAIAQILDDLRRHFPRANPKLVAWRRIDWNADPFARGGYSFLRPGSAGARSRLAAADTGALFWAGSESATEPIAATVGGAFSSGLRAARQALTLLMSA